ncbi:MAG: aminotransferase class I/II-fold pyridoxal phosphate-dependent enzyme [Boseongicola sp.]|nr:aminotransferase class I/II-fold pyridoxal phosphate-dependent enzyme [Boseongicola sp.]MDD9978631.1 aminotransferase class I/II-fold pyridoxal phosphate-dependent enzyme [Boseongicola sp.]
MVFPERFSNLPEYAFPRLRALLDVHAPGGDVLQMTIGEPRHAFPSFVGDVVAANLDGFGKYPPNEGTLELLGAITDWIARRYGVTIASDQVMVLNGTREGLYNAAMALCPETKNGQTPVILTPNPFYQVYAVAALSVEAEPVYMPCTKETGFLPDFGALPTEVLDRTAIAYICTPSNPQGAVADLDYWRELFALAEKHDFRIFADECYSEVYRSTPPVGALEAAKALGLDPERVVAFHSLSKRSNLPGLRSGFVAGGKETIARIRQLRTYAGAPLPLPLMRAAEAVWQDEEHVEASRKRYKAKYDIADRVFEKVEGCAAPEAGFFLWLPVDDGETATIKLWRETGVRVLPGAYLSRDVQGMNPGKGYIRVAMVVNEDELERGLTALRDCLYR